jgi:hypothetical protein
VSKPASPEPLPDIFRKGFLLATIANEVRLRDGAFKRQICRLIRPAIAASWQTLSGSDSAASTTASALASVLRSLPTTRATASAALPEHLGEFPPSGFTARRGVAVLPLPLLRRRFLSGPYLTHYGYLFARCECLAEVVLGVFAARDLVDVNDRGRNIRPAERPARRQPAPPHARAAHQLTGNFRGSR